FPAAEVKEFAGYGESSVLDFGYTWDAFDVEGEDSDLLECFLLDFCFRLYLQRHRSSLAAIVLFRLTWTHVCVIISSITLCKASQPMLCLSRQAAIGLSEPLYPSCLNARARLTGPYSVSRLYLI